MVEGRWSFRDVPVLFGWLLVGHGSSLFDCGRLVLRGCLNVANHVGFNLDGVDMNGKVFIHVASRTCFRPLCPKCYEKWAKREGLRAEHRLSAPENRKFGNSVHIVVSPPESLWFMDYKQLRRKAHVVMRRAGVLGGSIMFHHVRGNKRVGWRFSPHFHVVGFAFDGERYGRVKAHFERDGWVVKNLGFRNTVSGTIQYQLTHAGVPVDVNNFHVLTWFGVCSYSKLHVDKLESKHKNCPICGISLVKLRYFGVEPLREGDVWVDNMKDGFGQLFCVAHQNDFG